MQFANQLAVVTLRATHVLNPVVVKVFIVTVHQKHACRAHLHHLLAMFLADVVRYNVAVTVSIMHNVLILPNNCFVAITM